MQLPPPKDVVCERGHWAYIPTEDENWFRCRHGCEPVERKRTDEQPAHDVRG